MKGLRPRLSAEKLTNRHIKTVSNVQIMHISDIGDETVL
jgi:hypothetical protein